MTDAEREKLEAARLVLAELGNRYSHLFLLTTTAVQAVQAVAIADAELNYHTCPKCGGLGKFIATPVFGDPTYIGCPECKGSGYIR